MQQGSTNDDTGKIQFSTDGYVRYKTGADDDASYQGIYTEPEEPKQRVSSAYINASMMKKDDGADLEEYEDVKNVK